MAIFTSEQLSKIPHALSEPRFATYLQNANNDPSKALQLYQWNLEISSALMVSIHIYEIVIRNAVTEPLKSVYTDNWPWDRSYILSLPDPSRAYNPRKDLNTITRNTRNSTVGKVVAELKFAFWQQMFTARHDNRIWNSNFCTAFPNSPASQAIPELRKKMYNNIKIIRALRNRIAHHEPIFMRNLQEDYNTMLEGISWRDQITADWLNSIQSVSQLISNKPDI